MSTHNHLVGLLFSQFISILMIINYEYVEILSKI